MSRRELRGSGWLLLCRPGFEAPCAAEALERWRGLGGAAPQTERGQGWVCLRFAPGPLDQGLAFRDLVFARQGCWLVDGLNAQPAVDPQTIPERVPQWLAALPGAVEVLVEAPDGDVGRRLWPACQALQQRLADAAGPTPPRGAAGLRLHLVLRTRTEAWVGVAPRQSSSPLAGGIARLRHLRDAPSRSSLKLEEALGFFLGGEAKPPLRAGMRAVDLGAAPGGWSWVLARRGVQVIAVDNGPLARSVLDTGLVEAVRADGFTYRPVRPVDWLVCDIVAAPARVAKLVGIWARQGLCRRALFNLKLPSGDRLVELRRCEAIIRREVANGGGACMLRFKHLYHDRDELTGYLQVEGPRRDSRPHAQAGPPPRGRGGTSAAAGRGRRARPKRG